MKRHRLFSILLGSLCGLAAFQAQPQTTTALRATELRADKLASAAVTGSVATGAALRVVSLEGGWALVEAGSMRGWVRANAVNLQVASSAAAAMDSGRQAAGNSAVTLGTRGPLTTGELNANESIARGGLSPRNNRHALIIGVSRYAQPTIAPLVGVQVDKESATQMAMAMQVPASNINYLQDEQATAANIRAAIKDLENRVQDGDRVFIHYSGHGSRYYDKASGGCVEALLTYEGDWNALLTNREMASLLKPIASKTDKLFVMYDACHSGGIVKNAPLVRSLGRSEIFTTPSDEGQLQAKVTGVSEECSRPVNIRTRSLLGETVNAGALPQDIIHISAARDDEVSFDDAQKGGLATQFMRDCMLRDARDLDGSGAIDIDEIRQCAQEKLNRRMENSDKYKPHNITLSGNTGFVPAWFSRVAPVALPAGNTGGASQVATLSTPAVPAAPNAVHAINAITNNVQPVTLQPPATTPTTPTIPATPTAPVAPTTLTTPTAPATPATPTAPVAQLQPNPPASTAPPAQLTGEQALRQMFNQRDAKRQVQVTLAKNQLRIGQDSLDFVVRSDRPGYVYVAMAGSDNQALYLLFPNDLDQGNKVEAGQQLTLPRPSWRVKARGPVGVDNLLVLVTDGPRDLSQFALPKAGPFVTSLNDTHGRAALGALMATSSKVTTQECSGANRRGNRVCSDAYGAAMVRVEELK